MTDPNPNDPTEPQTDPQGDPQPSTQPQAGQATDPDPNPADDNTIHWPDGTPDYLRDKGPEETLDIMNKLVSAVRASQQQPTVQQQPAAQPEPPTEPEPDMNEIDDDLLVTNPAEWRRRFQAQQDQRLQQTLQQAAQPIYNNISQTAAEMAKKDPTNKDVSEKWWDEVEQMVQPIPNHMRSKALYDQAARMARANHLDEIAEERAQRLAASQTGVEPVGPAGSASRVEEADNESWDKIKSSEVGKHMLERYGKQKVVQAAKAMGGLDAYADMVAQSKTQADPEKPGRWHTELT